MDILVSCLSLLVNLKQGQAPTIHFLFSDTLVFIWKQRRVEKIYWLHAYPAILICEYILALLAYIEDDVQPEPGPAPQTEGYITAVQSGHLTAEFQSVSSAEAVDGVDSKDGAAANDPSQS